MYWFYKRAAVEEPARKDRRVSWLRLQLRGHSLPFSGQQPQSPHSGGSAMCGQAMTEEEKLPHRKARDGDSMTRSQGKE